MFIPYNTFAKECSGLNQQRYILMTYPKIKTIIWSKGVYIQVYLLYTALILPSSIFALER